MSEEELTLLKQRAQLMGIQHSPNIGVDALKKKIEDHMAGTPESPEVSAAPDGETKEQMTQRIRNEQQRDWMKLVRIRIANLNPAKADLRGEVVGVGNDYLGIVRKFIPFGEGSENGYHVPQIILDELRSREFNQVRTRRKGELGDMVIEQKMVKEYAIEVLKPLTPEELKTLAAHQAAAAGL